MLDTTTVVDRLRAAGCVFAEEEAALILGERRDDADTERMIARRVAGEPLETVVGWAAFAGLRIAVGPGVFVPRRRTEFLADCAIELTPARGIVADLCCGAGPIGAAILAARPEVQLHAADRDPVAVEWARRNLAGAASVGAGDLFDALPSSVHGRLDVVAANVPYVPTAAIALLPAEARDHEPSSTLDGGADGLALLRRVAESAGTWLAPGGAVLCEVTEAQAPAALAAFRAVGLTARIRRDEDSEATVIIGRRPGRRSRALIK